MTLQTIRDGLIATIVSQGKWNADQVSACDFGIATLSGSCVVLQPGPGSMVSPLAFGVSACGGSRLKKKIWDIAGMVLVKDPGTATDFLGKLWQACDDIYTSINADDTLNGAAQAANITMISRPSIDSFIAGEGADFGFITFGVIAEEYD